MKEVEAMMPAETRELANLFSVNCKKFIKSKRVDHQNRPACRAICKKKKTKFLRPCSKMEVKSAIHRWEAIFFIALANKLSTSYRKNSIL